MREAPDERGEAAPPTHASLRIPGVDRAITTLAEFEGVLRPRTMVPSQRYARFLELGDEALGAAAVTTRYAAEHLRRLLEDLRGRSGRVDAALRGIAPSFFSEDHAWRTIFKALSARGPACAEYQLLAISDYHRCLRIHLQSATIPVATSHCHRVGQRDPGAFAVSGQCRA